MVSVKDIKNVRVYDPTLCCVYSIPKEEAQKRLDTWSIQEDESSVHKTNYNFLNQKKDVIIQYMFQNRQWNHRKKQVNLFEKVNSYPNGVVYKRTYSRAYFKMIEMGQIIADFLSQEKPMRFLSLAEAPGGFVQGLQHIRDTNRKSSDWSIFDYYVANTLEFKGNNPMWDSDLKKQSRVKLMYGDVSANDFQTRIQTCAIDSQSRYDLITADCGVDVSSDFHSQEIIMYPLLLAQTESMLRNIKRGGCFILKIFETDLYHTKELMYFLGCCFRQVILFKPRTSRPLNSEKYMICRNCTISSPKKAIELADVICAYRLRGNHYKGLLWKESLPEYCLFLFHGYSRYCKEITNRHLQCVMKKMGDINIKLQYKIAEIVACQLNLPIFSNLPLEN